MLNLSVYSKTPIVPDSARARYDFICDMQINPDFHAALRGIPNFEGQPCQLADDTHLTHAVFPEYQGMQRPLRPRLCALLEFDLAHHPVDGLCRNLPALSNC